MRVAVTGATSDFGAVIVPALLADPDVDAVVGLGRRELRTRHPKLDSKRMDVRSPELADVFAGCAAVIHLAFVVEELRDKAETHDVNIRGSRNVVDSAARAGVRRLVVASSVNAYGAQDLPKPVTEDVFPSGAPDRYYFYDKAEVEHYVEWWLRRHPGEMAISLLRPCYVVGPNFANDGIDALTGRVLAMPGLDRAAFQFLHERDLASAFRLAVKKALVGPFNLGPRDWTGVRDLAAMHGQLLAQVPERPARRIADLLFSLRLSRFSGQWISAGEACVDATRFSRATGWAPALSSHEAAATMLLQRGRPVFGAENALCRKAACEAALEPATEIVTDWVAAVDDVRAVLDGADDGADVLERGLARLEHAQLPTPEGSVHVELHSAAGPRRACVVLSAGLGGHARLCTPLAVSLSERGIDVVIVDLPGHGLSTGPRGLVTRESYATAVSAAIRYASSRFGDRPYLLEPSPQGPRSSRWLTARSLAHVALNRKWELAAVLDAAGHRLPAHVRRHLRAGRDGLTVRRVDPRTATAQLLAPAWMSRLSFTGLEGRIPVAGPSVLLAGGLPAIRDTVLDVAGPATVRTPMEGRADD